MTLVVDASFWYLQGVDPEDDPRAAKASPLIRRLVKHHMIVAPQLLAFELANLVHHKHAEGRPLDKRIQDMRELLAIPTLLPTSYEGLGRCADRFKLTGYDAAYLEMARRRDDILITEDAELHAAGVKALGEGRCLRLAQALVKWGE